MSRKKNCRGVCFLSCSFAPMAVQQDAGEALRGACYADLDKGLDAREKGGIVILSTDCNCSIGVRDGDERDQVRGRHGEPHRNAAGDFFHMWAGQRKLRAASTHFARTKPRHGCGTWRHPRTKKHYQNDHICVQDGHFSRVIKCKCATPLCHTDHLSVKLTLRVQNKLGKRA